jgi:hypothetical protein
MATSWSFRPESAAGSGPTILLKKDGPVVFTKDYVKETLLSKKKYTQGTSGIITRVHTGFFGGITHLDVRLPGGEFVREVPVNYFLA